jgi:hypothetical protein
MSLYLRWIGRMLVRRTARWWCLPVSAVLLCSFAVAAVAQQHGMPRPGIDRPLREQRNLMYAAQDRLNALGYRAGGRDVIWKPPFTAALQRFQADQSLAQRNGDLDRETIWRLLGVDLGERQ